MLVDSPRAAGPLLRRARAPRRRRDAVPDAPRRRRRPRRLPPPLRLRAGAPRGRRHRGDARTSSGRLAGPEPVSLADDLLAIPTPGHTRGHAVLLYRRQLSLHRRPPRLVAPARARSWPSGTPTGTRGPRRSARWSVSSTTRFEWVLPGHGALATAPSRRRRCARELERCVAWMKERLRPSGPPQSRLQDDPAPGSPARPAGDGPPASRAERLADGRRLLRRREDHDAASAARRRTPCRAQAPAAIARCDRVLDARARRRPARGAAAPPTPARAPRPSRGSPRPSAASAISTGRVAHLVEARGHARIALEPRAEDLPVVHAGGVRRRPCRRGSGAGARRSGPRRAGARSTSARARNSSAVEAARERRVVVLDAGGLAEHARLDVAHEARRGPGPRTGAPTLAASAAAIATVSADEPPSPEPNGTSEESSISRGSEISRASSSAPARARPRIRRAAPRRRDALALVAEVGNRDAKARLAAAARGTRPQVDREVDRDRAGMEDVERPEIERAAREVDARGRGRFDPFETCDGIVREAIQALRFHSREDPEAVGSRLREA